MLIMNYFIIVPRPVLHKDSGEIIHFEDSCNTNY